MPELLTMGEAIVAFLITIGITFGFIHCLQICIERCTMQPFTTDKKQCFLAQFRSLKIGQCYAVMEREFEEAFRVGFPSQYETCIEHCLSCLLGSAYGAYKVRHIPEQGMYIVSRHTPQNRIFFVPSDRRHLYVKLSDGSYVLEETSN